MAVVEIPQPAAELTAVYQQVDTLRAELQGLAGEENEVQIAFERNTLAGADPRTAHTERGNRLADITAKRAPLESRLAALEQRLPDLRNQSEFKRERAACGIVKTLADRFLQDLDRARQSYADMAAAHQECKRAAIHLRPLPIATVPMGDDAREAFEKTINTHFGE